MLLRWSSRGSKRFCRASAWVCAITVCGCGRSDLLSENTVLVADGDAGDQALGGDGGDDAGDVLVRPQLAPPAGYTSSQLLFDEQFRGTSLDTSKWLPQIADQTGIWRKTLPAPYSGSDSGLYHAEYYDPAQVVVNDGLRLIAETSSTFSDYTWKSGCIDTHGLLTFGSGYVQIRAKMPSSLSGMWGGLWFLEGGGTIDLTASGYTASGVSANATMEVHLQTGTNTAIVIDTGVDVSADYHVYGMEYVPGTSLTMYFDDQPVASITQNVPTGAYTIVMSLSVAQNASSWHTVYDASTPPSEMDVSDVRLYALP